MTARTAIAVSAGLLAGTCTAYLLWSNEIGIRSLLPAGDRTSVVANGALAQNPFTDFSPDHERFATEVDADAMSDRISRLSTEPRSEVRDAELHALGALPAGAAWLAPALELLDTLGSSGQAIERIASFLPYARAQALRIVAVARLAERDAAAAIAVALTFDPPTVRRAALQHIAEVAARSDPRAALSHASRMIPFGIERSAYLEQVVDTWALLDSAGLLEYFERADVSGIAISMETLSRLASSDATRLLPLLDRLPADAHADLERIAVEALLAEDPASVYAYADALPAGRERDRLFRVVVGRHSQHDAKEALSYILAVNPLPVAAVNDAFGRLASDDLPYAIEKAAETLAAGDPRQGNAAYDGRLFQMVESALRRGARDDVATVVDFIANHPHQNVRRQLNGIVLDFSVLGAWAGHDPDSALAWAVRNPSHVGPGMVEHIGAIMAVRSVERAAQALNEFPEDVRGYWVAGVAKGLAASGLDAAVQWLEPARGAPVYNTVLESVLTTAASSDPVGVARTIDDMLETSPFIVLNVARTWAAQEPGAAGDWLGGSSHIDDSARTRMLGDIVLSWAERDLNDAERWARRQVDGPLRDAALSSVVRAAAAAGSLDTRLLGEFSSSRVLDQALTNAMAGFRSSDPELGRLLIDQYISDPELRTAAQRQLDGRDPSPMGTMIHGVLVR